jgi:regulator of protease activity HflC (stomatin/prohibitin superfamily)
MQRKMAAQQESQQAEYEQKKQEGLARAAVATANGQAQSTLINAKAQAESNHLLQSSITPTLVEYRKIEKWDGKLPTVSGGGTPLINIK